MTEALSFSREAAVSERRLRRGSRSPQRRLLHVFPNFDVGGAQIRFATLAAALGADYAHTVVALQGSYAAAAQVPSGAPVGLLALPAPRAGLVGNVRACRALLADQRPDLLLTYNWGAMEMALANLPAGVPHVHMEDGFGPDEAVRRLRRRSWVRRLALARAQVVTPSATLERIAVRDWGLAPGRVHHIPNGVSPRPRPDTPLHELGLGLDPRRPLIGWVGALRPEKNPLRLLRAFAPLRDRATLLVIGDGPERESVERAAAALDLGASLRLLGLRRDARDILMQCDVAALSSDTEQMPLVVLEAMEAALPVAACDVGDVRRMLSAENHPFLAPPEAGALGAALRTLVGDADLRRRVGAANRRCVAQFSLSRMVEAHRALIDRTAAQPRPWLRHA